MPHVHSPDGVYLASMHSTHSRNGVLYESLFQPDTRAKVDATLNKIWGELEQLATAQKFGLNNLLLSLKIEVFSEPALSQKLQFFVKLASSVNLELKKEAITNPFCLQEYASTNETLQAHFLDQAVTALWEEKVLPALKKTGGDLLQVNPSSLEAIRSCLTRPDLAPHLSRMTTLDLTRLPLRIIPPEIRALHNLQYLNLSDLPLTHFSPDFSSLTELREIRLRDCPLTEFSADLTQCVELKTLYVNNTSLQHFSIHLPPDSKLEHIDLSNNKLQSFEADLSSCHHLKHLSLAHNDLTGFRANLSSCTELRHLNLSDNQLVHFHPNLRGCSHLAILNLYDNPDLQIHADPSTNPELLLTVLLAQLAGN